MASNNDHARTLVHLSGIFMLAWLLNHIAGTWLLMNAPLLDDAREYYDLAVQLWRNGSSGAAQAYYWPPGGPYVLAAFFSMMGQADAPAAQLFMSIVSALTTSCVYLMTREIFRSERIAWVATALYGLSPTTIWLARQSETHTFSALWVCLLVWLSARYLRRGGVLDIAGAGLTVGLLVLTRPGTMLLLPFVLALPAWRWLAARKLPAGHPAETLSACVAQSGLAAVLAVGLLMPTLLHNHAHGTGWALSTNNERNFFIGNNPYTHPYKTGHLAWRSLDDLPPETRNYLLAHYEAPEPREAMKRAAMNFILDEPLKFMQRNLNRFVNFWAFDYEQGRRLQVHLSTNGVHGLTAWLPMALQAAYSVALTGLMALALPALWNSPLRPATLALLGLCLMYQAPHVLAFSSPVYRAGLAPLISAMAAAGLTTMRDRRARQQSTGNPLRYPDMPLWQTAAIGATMLAVNAQAAYYLVKLH